MRWAAPDTHWVGAAYPPRAWQAEALPRVIDALGDAPIPSIVQAIMGAGKSMLIAEICASAMLEEDEVVVVTTPTRDLVDQLHETIQTRLDTEAVGRFYSAAKDTDCAFIVACTPSAAKLANELKRLGLKCALWIADEAHRTECTTIHSAYETLAPKRAVGFTATPYRSNRYEELSLWKQEIVRYDVRSALRDGVIVPWRVVPWSGELHELDDVCLRMVRHGITYGPGLVSAVDCEDAEGFAGYLEEHDIPARAVHSRQHRAKNREILDALRDGHLDVVVHVSMLQEGVDFPWLRWLCMRRPKCSSVRFAQEVGRVLRSHPGKEYALVYDPHDHFAEYDLSLESVLEGMAEEAAVQVLYVHRDGDSWHTDVDPLMQGYWPGREVLVDSDAGFEVVTRITDATAITLSFAHKIPGELLEVRFAPPRARSRALARKALIPHSKLLEAEACKLTHVEAYLRQVTVSLSQTGVIERLMSRREWRDKRATPKQRLIILRQMQGCTPYVNGVMEPHRSALRAALRVAHAHKLSQGAAADLIRVLAAIRFKQGWPEKAEITLLEDVA